ncbi:MAG TPA: phosphatase PAP2 family protein [Gallionellaceae bacterium]
MMRANSTLQQISRWDLELCVFFNRQSRSLSIRSLFRIASRLGDGVFWYVLMSALLLHYRAEALPAVIHMILAGGTGTMIYKLIKSKTLRPRPFNVSPDVICVSKALDQFSFPSGHTLHATVFSIVAVHYFPVLIWLVLPFSMLVALSRPILGLHYPSDVLAGALIGAVLAAVSIFLV